MAGFLDATEVRAAGDIRFESNVYLRGRVEAGGSIRARGDLAASELRAGGDIDVGGEVAAEHVVRFSGRPPPLSSVEGVEVWDADDLARDAWELLGRDEDRRRLAQVLGRTTDPVLFLLGEPGVGLTTLLRATARAALQGQLPALAGKRFAALHLAALQHALAKGKNLSAQVADMASELARIEDVILVVDGLHYVAESDWGIEEVLKGFRPHLMSNDLRLVVATTPGHYQAHLSSDPLFGRRVEAHTVKELTPEVLGEVVRQKVAGIEKRYGVRIAPEAANAALEESLPGELRYRPPGSTIRLLDTAASSTSGEVTAADVLASAPDPRRDVATLDMGVLRLLEERVNRQVLGQQDAVAAVVRRIRLTKLQLDRRPERPDGVFLLLGPSGVGKTELAKAVTRALYGDLQRLVRLDMSEYMAEHEYAKAIGSPPGYIGHGEEGHLTGRVARLKHAVVLLDEIDKAHPSLLGLFLQVFDEGFLTDGKGQRVDFSSCVILMTTNMGRELWSEETTRLGFLAAMSPSEPNAEQVRQFLLKRLPAEFINRLDVMVPFRALDRDDLARILDKLVGEEKERWSRRGKLLEVSPEALAWLVERGYDPRLGARHLERNLELHVVQQIGDAMFTDAWSGVRTIAVDLGDDGIVLELRQR